MIFNLATLVLPLVFFGGIATATPLETREVKIVEAPGVDVAKLSPPIIVPPTITRRSEHTDVEKRAPFPGGSTTSANSAFRPLAGTIADQFVVCTAIGCGGTCYGYDLAVLQQYSCYTTLGWYTSFYIYQASATGLSYGISVSEEYCSDPFWSPVWIGASTPPTPAATSRTISRLSPAIEVMRGSGTGTFRLTALSYLSEERLISLHPTPGMKNTGLIHFPSSVWPGTTMMK
ncbi:hypothetical protein BS47DRAFT_1361697 [Hydnum rufescens UP504]|uniref:Uncharacterized protein n=1 Tax=Hydnum rufescens UP504 TaxID=1448309 RepID=A0A9P6DTP0_9AGAM|nr:hypothetical protein BS47DRAFT_1361697 [Hydnum rufescens UP504]